MQWWANPNSDFWKGFKLQQIFWCRARLTAEWSCWWQLSCQSRWPCLTAHSWQRRTAHDPAASAPAVDDEQTASIHVTPVNYSSYPCTRWTKNIGLLRPTLHKTGRFREPIYWLGMEKTKHNKSTHSPIERNLLQQNKHNKTKARFSCLLQHQVWKRRGPILVSVLNKFFTCLLT